MPAGVSPSLSSLKTTGFDEATAEHYYAELIKRSRGEFPLGESRNRYRAPTFKNRRVAAGLAATDDLKELVAGQLRSAGASSSSKKLLDMPVLCSPFEPRLLFWLAPIPVQPTMCVDPLLLGQLYREMLAHLQLVIITTMQGVTTNNWVDMMKPYLGKAPFTPLCQAINSLLDLDPKAVSSSQSSEQRHTAGGTARVPDFYEAAAACYLGGKRFKDPTGLDVPLSVGEIDRIKPDSRYDAARAGERVSRLRFSGFNDIGMDAIDDTPVVVYINGVKAHAHLWLGETELRLAK